MQQNAIFTLMDVLEPKSSKILQNTSFCIKDEVKTYGGGSEVTTEITHRVELIIDGIAVSFDKWVQVFGTPELTAALIDRFTHKCLIFNYQGKSVRFLDAKKRKENLKTAT